MNGLAEFKKHIPTFLIIEECSLTLENQVFIRKEGCNDPYLHHDPKFQQLFLLWKRKINFVFFIKLSIENPD